METKISDKTLECKKLETWKKKLKAAAKKDDKALANPDGLPKTVDACETKIKKLNEQISNETVKMHSTRDNA